MKKVVLLGSTGSIGTSTIKVAEDLPDQIQLVGLAAGNNLELLLEQTQKFQPGVISIHDPAKAEELRRTLGTSVRRNSSAHQSGKNVGRIRRCDSGFDRRESVVRTFLWRTNGGHELETRDYPGRDSQRQRGGG